MKKMNNKGFSLVELIIVIAIMAILAGAIAPALIRYIDKSRKSNDVSSCKTIKTAVETAMGNERSYEMLVNAGKGATIQVKADTEDQGTGAAITITGNGINNTSATYNNCKKEIGANIGEKSPKVKYTKDGATCFTVTITAGGTVKVYMAKTAGGTDWEVCPEICDTYQ